MCGRYTLENPSSLFKHFEVENPEEIKNLSSDYNVAPGRTMPVITRNWPNKITMMKWGLIPHWAKDPKIGYSLINARADSVAAKPSFRESFKKRRCLVPASGFYEWAKTKDSKVPYYFHLKNTEVFAFAGLYDVWKDAEGKEILSYTIITTEPNETVKKVHDRMPVILSSSGENVWLDHGTPLEALPDLLKPFSDDLFVSYPVSSEVNSPKNNDEGLIKPL